MRILVTGGAGYIGSHACVALMAEGHQIAILDNLSNGQIEAVNRIQVISKCHAEFFNVDVRDESDVEKVFDNFHPDAVIHFAGLKSVGESLIDPVRYYEWNVSGSLKLLRVMKKKHVKKLVFSSSANVYGDSAVVPISENAPIKPTNPYGKSKAMIEQILADVCASDVEWSIARLRYFNPMGAHQSGLIGEDPNGVPGNLPPYISQVAVGRLRELKIFGGDYPTPDGTGIRDYIHVMDLAFGHIAALNYLFKKGGLVTANLGTGRGYSVMEMISTFEKICGKSIPYRIVARRSGDVAQSFADVSHAERLLGWRARFGLEEMCRDAWNWQSLNPNGYVVKL